MATTEDIDVDLTDPALYRHGFPHGLFTDLRRHGPVARHRRVRVAGGDGIEFWAVLAHAEIQLANRDWETYSSLDGPTLVPFPPERRGMMIVSKDPPDHTRVRRLISAGFTPRMISRLDEQIRARTDRILDRAADRVEIDFVAEVANELPMHVIADIVGIPEDDRPGVFRLADVIIRSLDPTEDIPIDEKETAEIELFRYASALSADKRANPADDVWSILATGPLDGFELDVFFPILAVAGSETVRNTLAQGLMALLDHPDQMAELRGDPSRVPEATEEILRWASPATCFGRTVTRDVQLGGQLLRAGDRVGLFYPSANRDDQVFDDPFRFDLQRRPNPHVTFGGGGPHFCLGASLARTELQVMIGELLRRFTHIEITGEPRWVSAGPINNIGVAVRSLPVRLAA